MKQLRRCLVRLFLVGILITVNYLIIQEIRVKGKYKQDPILENDNFWQVFSSDGNIFYIFGAYLDKRPSENNVKILGMLKGEYPTEIYCNFHARNTTELITKVDKFTYMWFDSWGNSEEYLKPYLISCPYYQNDPPGGLSLFCQDAEINDAQNYLQIRPQEIDRKKGIAVCVKGLDFEEDISLRLIEWIELVILLGAERIYFYVFHVHANVMKVLNYYSGLNLLEFRMLTLPADLPNDNEKRRKFLYENRVQKARHEMIPLNDCFYQHQHEFKYFLILDIDEVIIPTSGNWVDLIGKIEEEAGDKNLTYYQASNVYFMDEFTKEYRKDIPEYMHVLQHVYRSSEFSTVGHYSKSFFISDTIFVVRNHRPVICIGSNFCAVYEIREEDALLHHYRNGWPLNFVYHGVVKDESALRFKDELIGRVQNTANNLKLI